MKKLFLSLFVTLTACIFLSLEIPVIAQAQSPDLYSFKIKKIKDNIYLAYRPEPLRKFVEENVTIIINEKDVILVDGGGSSTSAKNIIAEVRKLTPNPIRYVINTHFHSDHTLGNEEYVRSIPGVEIISHSLTRRNLIGEESEYAESIVKDFDALRKSEQELIKEVTAEAKPGYEKVVAYLARYSEKDIFTRRDEYAKIKVVPATLICDQKMVLHRGSRTIEILSIGPGDTPGDLIVYLPEDKVVCSGDMVVHPVPYGFSKNPLAWMETLKKLSELEFDYLVPGHGELQGGKTYVSDVLGLLHSVHATVKTGIEKGTTKESLKKEIDLTAFTKKYLNNDPVAIFRFERWFSNPAIENAYKIYSPNSVK